MDFEEAFDYVGQIGPYQVTLFVLLGLVHLFNGAHNMVHNFVTAPQEHWCRVRRLETFPHYVQKSLAIPFDGEDPDVYDSCRMYDLPYDNLTDEEIMSWNRSTADYDGVDTVECEDWVYDQSEFISTITSDFNLVCKDSWMPEFSSTVFIFGVLVGSLLSGILSDRFGRHSTMSVSLVGFLVAGVAVAFSPNYATFVVLRFLTGAFDMCSYLCSFVIVMEFIGPKYRVHFGVMIMSFFSMGFVLDSGISYVIRRWDYLTFIVGIMIVCVIPYIWIIPESPRWLAARGRYDEALKILKKAANFNGNSFPKDVKWKHQVEPGHAVAREDRTQSSPSDLCGSAPLRQELGLMYLNWFTTSLVYFGLSLNAGAFGGVFLNTMLSGLIEVPAHILCVICLLTAGRRPSNAGCLIVSGIFSFSLVPVLLTRPDWDSMLTALSTIGKGAITFSFASIYVFGAELFPTTTRHFVVGTSSTMARVGSMSSPYLGGTLADVWAPLPSLIFGSLGFLTGGLVCLLPETKGFSLPDTIEEAEAIARGHKDNGAKKNKSSSCNVSGDSAKDANGLDLDLNKQGHRNSGFVEDKFTYL